MSVLARMLAVLEASPARDSRSAALVSACQTASTAGRAVRRGRRPKSSDDLSSEKLEQRQLLAVSAYYDPVTNGGYATIVAEAGDNAFLQKVATASGSLYVAGDSSFAPGRRTEIPNIDALDRIVIREGTPRADDGVLPNSYPMTSPSVTTFALSGVSGWLGREFSGTMSLTQPDGSRSSWTFSNAQQIGNFTTYSNPIRFTSGIGTAGNVVGTPAKPGFYYPVSVQLRNDGLGVSWGRPEAMLVAWNVGQLPSDSNPTVDSVTWYQRVGDASSPDVYDNVRALDSRYIYDTGLQPSAPIGTLVFSLPNAAGLGRERRTGRRPRRPGPRDALRVVCGGLREQHARDGDGLRRARHHQRPRRATHVARVDFPRRLAGARGCKPLDGRVDRRHERLVRCGREHVEQHVDSRQRPDRVAGSGPGGRRGEDHRRPRRVSTSTRPRSAARPPWRRRVCSTAPSMRST